MAVKKMVYFFGAGNAEGDRDMRNLLGGKGANLAEMAEPRHSGSRRFHHHDRSLHRLLQQRPQVARRLEEQIRENIAKVEKAMGAEFGSSENPLLLSVRSGARVSMPGMMDTILNLGLNDAAVEGLIKQSQQSAFRLRQLPPVHPDVRRRRPRCRNCQVRAAIDEMKEEEGRHNSTPSWMRTT